MQTIIISGVPRSGTSWLGQLFNSSPHVAYRYQPLFSYAFKDRLDLQSTREDIRTFHRDLLATEDPFVLQNSNLSGNETPQFSKENITHLVWKEVRYVHLMQHILASSDAGMVGIIRHPCGVLKSWFQAPKEFSEEWSQKEEWRKAEKKNQGRPEEFYGFDRWKEATEIYIKLQQTYPSRVRLITYEELNRHTVSTVRELFSNYDLPLDEQTKRFISESSSTRSDDPYDVYRNNKDERDWEEKLDPEIIEAVLKDPDFQRYRTIFDWN